MTVKTWQAGSWISSANTRAYHSLTSGVLGIAERWKALFLWKARGTMVVRDGMAAGVASETSRFGDAVIFCVFVRSMSGASVDWPLVDDTCNLSIREARYQWKVAGEV